MLQDYCRDSLLEGQLLGAALSVGGAGIGLGPASVIPAALSSPRIAAGSLATSDVIEDLAKFRS